MKPQSSSLFSLLFFLLLPRPSLSYSFKNCSATQSDFSCTYKHLTTIPTDIPKSATSLYLDDNLITRIRQTDLTGFTRLKTLTLDYNTISHIEDGAFSDLSALTSLTLSRNKLTNLTDDTFKGLSNLSSLNLNNNQIQSISKFMFEPLKRLQNLYLSYNNLSKKSDIVNILLHCPSLENLDLGYNRFTVVDSGALSFPLIKHLSINGNNLTLFELDHLPFLLLNLTRLDLSSTPLRKFSVHSDMFPHLEDLSLSNVKESIVEWDVSDKAFLRGLTTLDLSLTNFTTESYRLIFQSVDSVEKLFLYNFGRLIEQDILDFACGIPSLQILYLLNSGISILNDTLLQSCTTLTELDLSGNSITDLSESSMRMLTRLSRLNFNSNELSRIPRAIRNMSTLTILSFNSNHIKELLCSDFLNLSSLTELELISNEIAKLISCVFEDLQNLQTLSVGNNRLLQLDDSFGNTLPNLLVFNIDRNTIGRLYKGNFQNMSSLEHLDLTTVGVTFVEGGAFEGLHNLKGLELSTNLPQKDTFAGLPRLETLYLTLDLSSYKSEESRELMTNEAVFNLPSLQTLHITVRSELSFLWTGDVLKGLDKLRDFSSNKFFSITPHQDTFLYTPHVTKLQIKHCLEWDSSPELFQPLTELQILLLQFNTITSLDFLSKANLTNVEYLYVNGNQLMVINETVFEALPSLKYLDLSGNPFACNCTNAGFIQWAMRNKQVQVVNAFQYKCSSPPSQDGHFLLDFDVQSCWEVTGFLCFIFSAALVLLTLLLSFIYHFLRWQLVYGFYLLLAFLYDSKQRKQGCPHIHDAFVSYNVHDEDWVYGQLLPELEEQQGWRLCLHHRDFQPGKAIIENITDAIYSSRKTLCVISRHYLQSEWCSREIQMASFRLFDEQKDVLILLFLEEIPSNQLSPFYRMRKLVKSRTYLSWTQARRHEGLFWEKVRRALESGHEPGDNHNPLTAII